jgi:thermostable 8-oxoguanine DNA glycosylase
MIKKSHGFDLDNKYGVIIKLQTNRKIVEETLTRIGICNKKTKKLTPSCYLKSENNCVKICHFKELLAMDGYKKLVTTIDYNRRNSIAMLLEQWGMIYIINRCQYMANPVKIFVLKSIYKPKYEICHKYDFKY